MAKSACRPHALVFPYPALGHIRPMMQLSQYLARSGFIITFANTLHNHSLILHADGQNHTFSPPNYSRLPEHQEDGLDIRLVGLPDGLSPGTNRSIDLASLTRAIQSMAPLLEQLVLDEQINPITCFIFDPIAIEGKSFADNLGIAAAAFWCPSIALARIFHDFGLLVSNGDVFPNGIPVNRSSPLETIKTNFEGIPKLKVKDLPWVLGSDEDVQLYFEVLNRNMAQIAEWKWFLCNSCTELEGGVIESLRAESIAISPIGPLVGYEFERGVDDQQQARNGTKVSLWPEDNECVQWLDGREEGSVIYISFGSLAMFNREVLKEIANGVETSGQAFLWVVREDLMDGTKATLPEGFIERTRGRGKVVSWAPQTEVLRHGAIGGFMTHCGWNSTLEAVLHGVPVITWPYFADQFVDQNYLVDAWHVGIKLQALTSEAIHAAVAHLFCSNKNDSTMRTQTRTLATAVAGSIHEGGMSKHQLDEFVAAMQSLTDSASTTPANHYDNF